MAYTAGGLTLLAGGNGFQTYRYDSLDASTDVDGSGYFNNLDDDLNLAVGDLIWVFDWDTAVRTGTLNDVTVHAVMTVNATTGVVDLSNDLLGATLATGD